jgi:hypothetical protein
LSMSPARGISGRRITIGRWTTCSQSKAPSPRALLARCR